MGRFRFISCIAIASFATRAVCDAIPLPEAEAEPAPSDDITPLEARQQTYYFSGAVQVSGSSGSAAVQAQCPADHPQRCDNIGEEGYCCPSGNTCQWSNSQVACCPNGGTCNGWYNGVITSSYNYYTSYAPSTVYQQPTTVYVAGGGAAQTTQYYTPATTTVDYYNGQYCSTLTQQGPNLPTTAQGNCGTILIVEPNAAIRHAFGWTKLGLVIAGLQVLGGLVLRQR